METTYTWAPIGDGSTRMTLHNRGEPAGFSKLAASPVPVVASGVEEGDDHGQDPFGAAGHVHVGRTREHGELAVWQQLGRLDGVGHAVEVVVADEHQRPDLDRPQVVGRPADVR